MADATRVSGTRGGEVLSDCLPLCHLPLALTSMRSLCVMVQDAVASAVRNVMSRLRASESETELSGSDAEGEDAPRSDAAAAAAVATAQARQLAMVTGPIDDTAVAMDQSSDDDSGGSGSADKDGAAAEFAGAGSRADVAAATVRGKPGVTLQKAQAAAAAALIQRGVARKAAAAAAQAAAEEADASPVVAMDTSELDDAKRVGSASNLVIAKFASNVQQQQQPLEQNGVRAPRIADSAAFLQPATQVRMRSLLSCHVRG